jgi:hypothetical protein
MVGDVLVVLQMEQADSVGAERRDSVVLRTSLRGRAGSVKSSSWCPRGRALQYSRVCRCSACLLSSPPDVTARPG